MIHFGNCKNAIINPAIAPHINGTGKLITQRCKRVGNVPMYKTMDSKDKVLHHDNQVLDLWLLIRVVLLFSKLI